MAIQGMCTAMRGSRAFAAAVVTVALAGCGGSQHPTVSSRVVAAAAAKTTAAGPARIVERITGTLKGDSLGEGSAAGIVESRRRDAALTFDLSPLAKADGSDPDSLKGELVYLGENAFLLSPAIHAKLPAGKRWIELTRRQLDAPGGGGASFSGIGALDATKPVDHLRAAVGDAERLGTGDVAGVRAAHYRTHVDYRKYVSLVPRDQRATLRTMVAKLDGTLGETRFPVDVWIAADGTIRRTDGVIEGRGLKLEYTLYVSEVGKPAPIAKPPASRVLDGRKPP
jgi:hypothetical protein